MVCYSKYKYFFKPRKADQVQFQGRSNNNRGSSFLSVLAGGSALFLSVTGIDHRIHSSLKQQQSIQPLGWLTNLTVEFEKSYPASPAPKRVFLKKHRIAKKKNQTLVVAV